MGEILNSSRNFDGLLHRESWSHGGRSYPVGDAEMLRRLRKALGPAFPIVVTHDFHANVSYEIVRDSTVLITYKENPHIDTKERGVQAARIMAGIVSGKLKPVQAVAKPEMLYNIVFQYTRRAPLLPIVQESRLEQGSESWP
jgi:microcystin degradation protein MlrC